MSASCEARTFAAAVDLAIDEAGRSRVGHRPMRKAALDDWNVLDDDHRRVSIVGLERSKERRDALCRPLDDLGEKRTCEDQRTSHPERHISRLSGRHEGSN